jgi:hypothetical protein
MENLNTKTITVKHKFLNSKKNKEKNKEKNKRNEINKEKIMNLSKILLLKEKEIIDISNQNVENNSNPNPIKENTNLLDFFEKLNLKKKRKTNKTIKDNSNTKPSFDIKTQLNKTPKWGCLKNGNLPTKPKQNKTYKLNENENENKQPIVIDKKDSNKNINFNEFSLDKNKNKPILRENRLHEFKKKEKKDFCVNKTIKKHLLGKQNGKISVLLKNNKTIKKIRKDLDQALNQDMPKITEYLKKNNLIKVGSIAPNELKKQIYEQAILTGHVKNTNDDNILYNFINDNSTK